MTSPERDDVRGRRRRRRSQGELLLGEICVETRCPSLNHNVLAIKPIPPHKAIYGLNAALAHNDGHISRLFVDCISYM